MGLWNRTRIYLLTTLLIWIKINSAKANEEILLDTRTALSDLGWTMSQDSEWQEMTGSDKNGNDLRMHMVCQITKPHQNNWLRTPYIPVNGAKRVYVEVEFTIRSCEDVPNVATCKETFNLFYYETDRDEATTTFPPWRDSAYQKVDTIAADQRFQPGTSTWENTNFETRDIGPIKKNGIYLAIQDTGACVALMHVRVYYKYCSEATQNLAVFSRTTAGPEMTSLVEATGHCVRNAIAPNKGKFPSLYCNAEGEWTVPSRQCVCSAGYQPSSTSNLQSCEACQPNSYKSTATNQQCTTCPNNSMSRSRGSTVCDCMYGYYRVHSTNSADQPCSKPPGKPINLYSTVNQTSVYLSWGIPVHYGGISDITYSIKCYKCQSPHFINCGPCSNKVKYLPEQNKIQQLSVNIKDLSSFAFYKFEVYAETEVTKVALSSGHQLNNYEVATIETNQAAPSQVIGVRVSEVESDSFLITWDQPTSSNGQIQNYDITIIGEDQSQFSNKSKIRSLKVEGLKSFVQYTIKVRARTLAGYGPYSTEVKVQTLDGSTITAMNNSGDNNGVMTLVAAIGGGLLIVFIVIGVLLFCRRRSRNMKSKLDPEKIPMYSNNGSFTSHYSSPHKTYIDPTTYEDPNKAVREFTKEIDGSFVKIEEVIGGGEFGEVCRGTLQPPNKKEQDIAIKTLKTGYSTQQKLDFLGEASIMGQFDHPNVIRLEGVVTKSRPLMIITEFMENGSLDAFLRNHDNEFNVIQLVGMLRNIAAGMKYLSDMGYVHRDLAARNILVNAQLICKVSDFGMSRVLEEDSEAAYTTRGGKIPIRWTAPEAFTFRKFTSASDVWSYGIVMWEVMSYGERPYWGMSNRDVMNAVESGYRLPAPMDCPQVQHKLMLESWKKDRNQRPKFGQIVASLDKMLRDPSQLKLKAGPERSRNGRLPGNQTNNQSGVTSELIPKTNHQTSSSDSGLDEDSPMMTSQTDTSSLGAWLEGMGMGKYKEDFNKNGCNSVEQIKQLDVSELERIGITNKSDQELILTHVQELNKTKRKQSGLPTYAESNLIVGISV